MMLAQRGDLLSYADEARALALRVAVELQAMGVKFFIDEERFLVGDRLSFALEEAVAKADVFVLVATPDGLASEWTKREFLLEDGRIDG